MPRSNFLLDGLWPVHDLINRFISQTSEPWKPMSGHYTYLTDGATTRITYIETSQSQPTNLKRSSSSPALVCLKRSSSSPALSSLTEENGSATAAKTVMPLTSTETAENEIAPSSTITLRKDIKKDTKKIIRRCCTRENKDDICHFSEILNAITMLPPFCMAYQFVPKCHSWCAAAAVAYSLVHVPFSMAHHLNLGLGDPQKGQAGLGLLLRRLDYTFIQVGGFVTANAAWPNAAFRAAALALTAWALARIWRPPGPPGRPLAPDFALQGAAAALTVLGLALGGHGVEAAFLTAGLYMTFDMIKFQRLGHLWSHPAMHLLLVWNTYFVLRGSTGADRPAGGVGAWQFAWQQFFEPGAAGGP